MHKVIVKRPPEKQSYFWVRLKSGKVVSGCYGESELWPRVKAAMDDEGNHVEAWGISSLPAAWLN